MKHKIPHIQVDAFPLVDDHFSGVGHYTLGIVRGLEELAGEGKLTYSLIVPKRWGGRLKKYDFENMKITSKNVMVNGDLLFLTSQKERSVIGMHLEKSLCRWVA